MDDKAIGLHWWLPIILALFTTDATGAFTSSSSRLLLHRRGGSTMSAAASTAVFISESRPGSSNDDGKRRVYYGVDGGGHLVPLHASHKPLSSKTGAAALPAADELQANAQASTLEPIKSKQIRKIVQNSTIRTSLRLLALLRTIFLPVGYPHSVRPEYLRYQQWNVVQDLSTYLRGILATQAILEGVGVGRAGATPLAATIQWIVRDGTAMMSGLVFTSLLSTNFGVNAKSWRLFADFSVDVGITLDMLAPLFPKRFLLLICLSSVCKSLCGISAGAANGAIVEHMAQTNNLAEVLAKGGAQHTAVSLFGLGFGMWFARVANQSPRRVWGAYIILTLVHLIANYAAMRVLAFTSINRHRLDVLLGSFWAGEGVPLPATVARRETILVNPRRWWWLPGGEGGRRGGKGSSRSNEPVWKIRLGARVKDLTASVFKLNELQEHFQGESYMLNVVESFTTSQQEKEQSRKRKGISNTWPQVVVALREDATNLSLLKASFHAYLLQKRWREGGEEKGVTSLIRKTYEEACMSFPLFEKGLLRQGWNLERVLLSPEGWVYHTQEKV